jgi:phage baseplate assembly protein W
MPFNPQQINPVDLNPNVAVGVNLPFSGPAVFTQNYLTSQATKNNIINYFLTNPGDIPLNPAFGGGLRNFIFEQIAEGTLNGLKENISDKMENIFPEVIVDSINVLRNDDLNEVIVQMKYSIANSNITDNITFQF